MESAASILEETVKARRSVRRFDSDALNDDTIVRCARLATLAPSSSNMQLYEFYRVKSPDKLNELAGYCLGQPAATTAKEMMVFVVRADLWKQRAAANLAFIEKNMSDRRSLTGISSLVYYKKIMPMLYFNDKLGIWGGIKKIMQWVKGISSPAVREVTGTDVRIVAHKSCALAAQTFMLTLQSHGLSSCPMEGYDSKRVKKMLDLPGDAEINMIVSYGKGNSAGIYGERFRVPFNEIYREL